MAAEVRAMTRLSVSVPEAATALGISVRNAWKLIASGQLRAKNLGRRTIVESETLRECLAALPSAGPGSVEGRTRA